MAFCYFYILRATCKRKAEGNQANKCILNLIVCASVSSPKFCVSFLKGIFFQSVPRRGDSRDCELQYPPSKFCQFWSQWHYLPDIIKSSVRMPAIGPYMKLSNIDSIYGIYANLGIESPGLLSLHGICLLFSGRLFMYPSFFSLLPCAPLLD